MFVAHCHDCCNLQHAYSSLSQSNSSSSSGSVNCSKTACAATFRKVLQPECCPHRSAYIQPIFLCFFSVFVKFSLHFTYSPDTWFHFISRFFFCHQFFLSKQNPAHLWLLDRRLLFMGKCSDFFLQRLCCNQFGLAGMSCDSKTDMNALAGVCKRNKGCFFIDLEILFWQRKVFCLSFNYWELIFSRKRISESVLYCFNLIYLMLLKSSQSHFNKIVCHTLLWKYALTYFTKIIYTGWPGKCSSA